MQNTARRPKITVSADGKGLVSQAGTLLLAEAARVTGLGQGLAGALARWRASRAVHDPGKILTDLAVAVALGGDCLADVAVLRAVPQLCGPVASDPVISRLISALAADGPRALRAIRKARAAARERAWALAGDRAPGADGGLTAGRTLAAANADLPWPGKPHLALWHAIGVLREHRGDGHITALLAAGLDPCEALVSFAAIGAAPEEVFASRGWTTAEWAAARDRLASRGWADPEGKATKRGREVRDEVEWRTDRLAGTPWQALGPGRSARLAELTAPLLGTALESGLLPAQSTLGIAAVPPPAPRPQFADGHGT